MSNPCVFADGLISHGRQCVQRVEMVKLPTLDTASGYLDWLFATECILRRNNMLTPVCALVANVRAYETYDAAKPDSTIFRPVGKETLMRTLIGIPCNCPFFATSAKRPMNQCPAEPWKLLNNTCVITLLKRWWPRQQSSVLEVNMQGKELARNFTIRNGNHGGKH